MIYGGRKVLNYKIVILILLLGLFLINMASAASSNSKFDKDNNSLIIKSPTADKVLLTVRQISVKPDLVTMEEIFKITAYENYTFKKNKDFNIRWNKHRGKNDITGSKWEILEEVEYTITVPDYMDVEKNKTISNILTYTNITDTYDAKPERLDWGERHAKEKWRIQNSNGEGAIGFDRYQVISTDPLSIKFFWNVTEQIGRHQEAKYRDEWRPLLPNDKTIRKNESYTVKLTLYKQAETGDFSIKTIPMFAGIEEERFTWWNGSWKYYTGNPVPNSARPYQLSLNLSNSTGTNNATHVFLNRHAHINFTDIRFTLDNTTPLPYWIEDNSTGRVWVNVTGNGTVNLYYGNPSAVDSRDGNSTFEFYDDFTDSRFSRNPVISPVQPWESGSGDKNRWGSIALVNGTYYVYFTNNTNPSAAIGRATSTDLINWTKYANNPVIKNAIGPSLLKDLDGTTPIQYNGKYWMATMTSSGSVVQIRSAADIDSDTWVVENSAALLPQAGTWYSSMVFSNSFIREGSTYYLVFQGYDNIDWRIGYATASAPGGPYAVQGILLQSTQSWEGNATLDPEVRKFGDTYYLFYTGGDPALPPGQPYNNSYATSTSLTGSYTKSLIQLTPLQHTYPAILWKDPFYYILDDDQTTTGKDLFKRADLNGRFGSPFKWDSGDSPTVSGTELLLNAPGEFIRSDSTFLYKALKIKAKYAAPPATYQYLGFTASNIGSNNNSEKFESSAKPDLLAYSGNSNGWVKTNVYDINYFGSYHNYEILWRKGESKFIIDGELKATQTTYVADTPLPVGMYNFKTSADFYVDWVFVRNYVSPEPVWAVWSPEQVLQSGNEPTITSWTNNKTNDNGLTLTVNTSEAVKFNATANQTITNWNWYKDGVNQNNNLDSFTTSWDTAGARTVKVNATNANGTSNTVTWNIIVNAVGEPVITSYDPPTVVSDYIGATRTFSATWNQMVNVTWYINGSQVQVNNNVITASYTNNSATAGTWNITAVGANNKGTANLIWIWIVRAQGPWYNPNWHYRKPVEINNSGQSLTNYQVNLTVNTRSLILAGKLNPDGSDLRFTDSDGITLLPFWNETAFNLTNTTIWVKVPSVTNPANTTIYMYYGYPAASSTADGNATFEFFENNFLMPLDNNATYLNTPTYDGSNKTVHPDIYYNASGWNGYKYWMAITPYPDAAHENPSILVSNDGSSWVVPPGLTNPIDYPSAGAENSDVDIIYNETSDRLEVYYVEDKNASQSYLKRRTSTNGISWSNEEDIFNLPDYQIMSPAIIKNGSTYHMWYDDASACNAPTFYVRYRTSSDGINWSSPQNVNINQPGLNIWHVDVSYIPSKNEYWMIYAALPGSSCGGNTDLYFAKSIDRINWTTYGDKIIGRGASWDSTQIYRSTFLYNSSTDALRVWYSASGSSGWHTGYTERQYPYFKDGLRWSRNGNTGSSTANPRDGIYGLRQIGGVGASPEHKLWQRSNSSGSYSYNLWYKDELSTVPSYLAALTLKHGATFSNIGVSTDTSTANYTAAISGSYSDTGIARTTGWHKLEIRVNNSGIYYYVNGRNAGSAASVTSSTNITPSINGYSAGTAFYDDYYIRKYTFPEPTYIVGTEETAFAQSPAITTFAPSSPVSNNVGDSRVFNITTDQVVNVTWHINGTQVQFNENVIEAAYTSTSAPQGTWIVNATATNANGSVSKEWTWIVASPPSPNAPAITGFTPSSPVSDTAGANRAFNITTDQVVNVTWYINGTEVFNQTGVIQSTYTNTSAATGTWNVSSVAQNTNGSTMQTWIWSVSSAIAAPVIFFTDPTPADNATLAQNYAYINTTVLDPSDTTALIDWNRSLAGWWRFNNESGENSAFFKDWSSRTNDGTCTGTGVDCPISTSGRFGNALSFNGLTDYISAGLMASDSSGTMEAWIRPNNYIKNQYVMGGTSSNGADTNARFDIFVRNNNCPSGDWGTVIANGITAQTVCSGQTYNSINFPSGIWKHIAVTYNGSAVNVFTDGVLVKTDEQTVSGAGNAQPFSIGRIGAYPGLYFDGSIDEVRIHKRALSTEEIKASYNSGFHRLYGNFTDLAEGVYNYKAYAQNTLGHVNLTETRTLTLTATSVLASIIVSPSTALLTLGGTQQFNATALDQNNNPMPGVNISWSVSNSTVGSVVPLNIITGTDGNASATFITSVAGTAMVNATNGSVKGTAFVTVDIVPQSVTVFAQGADNSLWYREWNGASWDSWQSLGGFIYDFDAKSGYVAARGADNGVWYRERTGISWRDWQNLGGSIVTRPVIAPSGGNIYIFARGEDNGVWTRKWDGSAWGDWQGLGGSITSEVTAASSGSEISIYARGEDNGVWTRKWNGAAWSDWQGLGGFVTSNISATASGSEISIYARGADNGVWTRKWDGSAWGDWQGLGGIITSDVSATASDNEISIFARGADNGIWTRKWNGAAWSDWQGLGGSITSDIFATASGSEISIYARGADNGVWTRKWDGSAWSDWQGLGGSIISEPVVTSG